MEETQIAPKVSVLIVSYNRAGALRRCLEALERSAGRENFEIIVVDNASQDGSTDVIAGFPGVTPLHLPRNFGFTKALNIGMRTAKGEFFFILNARTEVEPETVAALAAALEAEPDAVAVCPLLATPEGQPARHIFRLPRPDRLSTLARLGAFDPAEPGEGGEIEFAGFAAAMVRGYFLKGLRYIDEHYAQSWADAEIAAQIQRAGKKTLAVPAARAVWHNQDDLIPSMPEAARALLAADWALGAATYAGKHFGFAEGLKVRLGTILMALLSLDLRRLSYLVAGERIDGTQAAL